MTDETGEKLERMEFVYTGPVTLAGKEPGVALFRISEDGLTLTNGAYFSAKAFRHKTIGAVYAIEADAEKARLRTAEYVRMWHNKEDVLAWRTAADAREVEAATKRLEQKGKHLHLEVLDPLRRVYRETNYTGRLAIEVQVLAYLRGSKTIL